MKRSFFLALLLIGLVGCAAKQSAQTPKRIVLLAGRPSHPAGMHEFRAGCLLFQKALAGVPGVTVQVFSNGWPTRVEGEKTVDDNAALETADAVLIYADGGGGHPAIRPDRLKFVDSLEAKGVGLAFAHFGVEVPKGEPGAAMHRWAGGYYEHQFSVNPMWKPDYTTLPKHAVTRGVQPFATHDEWYFNLRWVPDTKAAARLTPILVAKPTDTVRRGPYVYPPGPYAHIVADSGRTETMMWLFERENGGRSFGFTGGHTHANWGDANQRRVVLNALLWIARVEVPKGGVIDPVGEADLAQNLDPKKR
jgi:hypothetical protein